MEIILYEDEAVSKLSPITLVRPAYDIRTGGFTLLEAIKHAFPKASVSSYTRKLVRDIAHVPEFVHNTQNTEGFLFLNARLAPSLSALVEISAIMKRTDEDFTLVAEGGVAGFFCGALDRSISDFDAHVRTCASSSVHHPIPTMIFNNPEDVVFFNRDYLGDNLTLMTKKMRSKKRGFYIGKGVQLPKEYMLDTTHGPVVLGDHVVVHPYVVLRGPLFVGESSIVKEFSVVSDSTIGPVCKVGGEVEDTIMDGYSNKQHAGGIANSYIGRWVNIGGGTYTADLKNTYSHISIDGRDSGAQFLGSIFGDYSKTSINTSTFPGRVIGMCAHLYGLVAEDVPSFTSHVRTGILFELPVGLAEKGQKAMAMRRGAKFTEQDTARMVHVFDTTANDREAAKVSKEKISFY